jgi:hypothetical protein
VQNVHLGSTITFDFTVSDYDDYYLYVNTETCPSFANNLYRLGYANIPSSYGSYMYRLTIYPPLTGFSLVGTQSCKISLSDTYDIVYKTLQINVKNRAPYLTGTITSKSVALNAHLVIDLSTNFYDDDSNSLTINVAKYTFNGAT